MYAIIRTGGKQSKVSEGDVIDVERIKDAAADGSISFTPLLLVNDDGSVVADQGSLDKATVTAKVVGEHRGNKVEVFKYKNKTGNRRRMGHRQTYTTIEVTGISAGAAKKKAAPAKKAAPKATEEVVEDAATDAVEEA